MVRRMSPALVAWFLLPLTASAGGGKDAPSPGDEQFLALRKEYQSAVKGVEGDEKKQKVAASFAGRFLTLATKLGKDEAAVDALLWVLINAPQTRDVAEAAKRLDKQHVQSMRLKPKLLVIHAATPDVEHLLRSVMNKHSDRDTQGVACLALAQLLRDRAGDDHPKIRQDSINTYELCMTKFADCTVGGKGPTIGERARPVLFEMRNLVIGKVVPDIVGEDFDGAAFKLSDYRGKVVMLSYWATWCPPCMGMVPHEKALVKRLEGKPFVLIGANGDPRADLKKVKLRMEKEQITWRSFVGGGATAAKWNIEYWPTIFLIDHNGVIRHRFCPVDPEELNRALDTLVAAANKSAGKRR